MEGKSVENKYKKAIKEVLPSVVSITFSKNLELAARKGPVTKIRKRKRKKIDVGGGSGFLVSENGIVLTNRHVVKKDNDYTVILQDGRKYKPKVLDKDPINDIAILKIGNDNDRFPCLKLGDSSKLELGDEVIAIGNALGIFQNTVSAGIISGLSRSVIAQDIWLAEVEEKRLNGLIQTDAAINPGNSGGPLILLNGETIGINAIVVSGAENIAFAVPINMVKKDLEEIRRYGRIRKPYIGIRYLPIDEMIKEKLKLPIDYGVLIVAEPLSDKYFKEAVIKGSPAYKAGIREKDIITEIDGEKITMEKTIPEILQKKEIGKNIKIKLIRNGKTKAVYLKLKEK